MASPAAPAVAPELTVRGDRKLPAFHAALGAIAIVLCVVEVREQDYLIAAVQAVLAITWACFFLAGVGARLALRGEVLELSRLLRPPRAVSIRDIAGIDANRQGLRFDVRGGSALRFRARRHDAAALLEALRGRVDAAVERDLDAARGTVLGPP